MCSRSVASCRRSYIRSGGCGGPQCDVGRLSYSYADLPPPYVHLRTTSVLDLPAWLAYLARCARRAFGEGPAIMPVIQADGPLPSEDRRDLGSSAFEATPGSAPAWGICVYLLHGYLGVKWRGDVPIEECRHWSSMRLGRLASEDPEAWRERTDKSHRPPSPLSTTVIIIGKKRPHRGGVLVGHSVDSPRPATGTLRQTN